MSLLLLTSMSSQRTPFNLPRGARLLVCPSLFVLNYSFYVIAVFIASSLFLIFRTYLKIIRYLCAPSIEVLNSCFLLIYQIIVIVVRMLVLILDEGTLNALDMIITREF